MNNLSGAKRLLYWLCACVFACVSVEAFSNRRAAYQDSLISMVSFYFIPGGFPQVSPLGLPDSAKMRIGKGYARSIAYSPDSRRIAVGGSIGVWIYDARNGKEIALLRGHTEPVYSAVYSPDGTMIVSGSGDKTIRIWSAETGDAIQTLEGHQDRVNAVAYSPDGTMIVSGSGDKTIRLWNAETGGAVKTLEGHQDKVNAVAYSPDGTMIASGSGDKTVKIWNANTGALLDTFKGHQEPVDSVAYSPDGKRIASGDDETARIWDAESIGGNGAILDTQGAYVKNFLRSVAYSPDGHILAVGGIRLRVWSAADGTPLQPFDGSPIHIAFSPDGHFIAGVEFFGTIRIWNVEIRALVHELEGHTGGFEFAAFSPDGTKIVLPYAGCLYRWDLNTGNRDRYIFPASYKCFAFSPDGTKAVWVSRNELMLGNAKTGKSIRRLIWNTEELIGNTGEIEHLSFSPNASTVVSAGADRKIRIWDFFSPDSDFPLRRPIRSSDGPLKTLTGHTDAVVSAVYSPDGKTILSAGRDKTIRLWSAAGDLLKTFKHTSGVHSAVYSPDKDPAAREFAAAFEDGAVRIYNAETGKLLKTLTHTEAVMSAAYSPDGAMIASGSKDNAVRIWSRDGALLHTLEGHTDDVNWVGFSPDSKTLASTSGDGTLLLWGVSDR